MRIGLSGRIGVGIALFAAVADAASWLVRAIDNYPFGFYELSDAYLPFIFAFGLALLLPSISTAIQAKRAANSAKFSLTAVGPLPPELGEDSRRNSSGLTARRQSVVPRNDIPIPQTGVVSSCPHRKRFQRLGAALLLLATILYGVASRWLATLVAAHPKVVFAYAHSYDQFYDVADLCFCLLLALGIALLLWPYVREMQGMCLGVEPLAVRTGSPQPVHTPRTSAARTKLVLHHPAAACAAGSVLAFVLPIFFMLLIFPNTPHGLMVHIPKPGTFARADEPWKAPLVVRIDSQRDLYLNRQPVPLAGLGPRLLRALSLRADWTVFVDGAADGNAGDVIAVTDIIHGIGGAKVLLVTPSMAKENPVLSRPPFCVAVPVQEAALQPPPKYQRTRYAWGYYPLRLTISERGEVSNAKLYRGSGIADVDEWIVRSAEKWKFRSTPGCGAQDMELYVPVFPR